MNPDQPSREQIEARITALLLGELPADEAALLRYTIAQDPALKKLHDELQATLVLVREAAKHPAEAPMEKPAPLKLSSERRQKLLAHFKTPRPKVEREPLFWLKRIQTPSLVEVLVVVAIIGVLAAMMLPSLSRAKYKARATSQANAVINNLRQIDAAKEQWALQNNKSANDVPTVNDLSPYIKLSKDGRLPSVMGETYVFGKVSEPVAADVDASKKSQLGSLTVTTPADGSGKLRVIFGEDQLALNTAAQTAAPEPKLAAQPAAPPPTPIALPADQPEVVASTANSTAAVTLASEPQPAPPIATPPITQIVLPQPESTPKVAAQSGAPANTGQGGVYSQEIVGYVNVPANSNLVALPLAETAPAAAAAPAQLVQDGKVLYEMGKFDAAKTSLNQAIASDPNNTTATYYLNQIKQKELASNVASHNTATQERMERVEKQWILPSSATDSVNLTGDTNNGNNQNVGVVNAFAGSAGGGGGGFSGFGGSHATGGVGHGTDAQYRLNQALVARSQDHKAAGETDQSGSAPAAGVPGQAPSTATFAFDDVDANRTKDLPANARQTFQWSLGSNAAPTLPQQLPALALNETAGEDKKTITVNSGQLATSGLGDREINGTVGREFYRFPTEGKKSENPPPTSLSQSAASFASAAPPPPPSVVPAAPLAGSTLNFDAGAIPAENGITTFSGSTVAKGGYSLTHHNLQQGHAPDSLEPATTAPALGLNAGGVISGAAPDSFQTGLAKEDAEGLRYLVTNGPQPSSTPENPNPFVTRYASAVPTAGALDQLQSTNFVALNDGGNNTFNPGVSAITPDAIDINEALDRYAKLTGRTVMRSSLPSGGEISLPKSLSEKDETTALQAALALNDVSLINIGDKFVKVVPSGQAGMMGGDIDRSGSTNAPAPGSYVTQVVQLRYVKPTAMVSVVRPFTGLANSILPIDGNGTLVLRDTPENVERMVSVIEGVDANMLTDSIVEAVPIHYSNIGDIATALNTLGSEQEIPLAGKTKIIENQHNSSLLVFATRADMDVIKATIAKLDVPDLPLHKPAPNTPLPQPEILTSNNAFSTFSLNVSDVSFKFAEASLQNGKLPDTASIRSEEFINAFDYRDPEAAADQPMAFTSERARYPFAYNRDLLRFSVKTAAAGRQAGRPLNLVLLLDTSGSMERADRVAIIREALRVLATQLHENDIVSVVSFSRTARLWADGISGGKAGETLDKVGGITPEGGTNLEEAMRLAYETARRHYLASGLNRVVLLTDGAANLGNVDPSALKDKVEAQRKQGIALDCFGIGWEDYNDDLLEQLSSNGDGRYAFLNSPEDASKDFAAKLAGALQVAAEDVKVQVEFNPQRVISYRQIGYATHQLTKEQFRDNSVAAAPIAAQEAGNALYTIETNPNGDGPIATVHVRYRIPGTQDYRERSWDVAYTGNAPALENSSPAMRLAATASAFSEWLAASPYAQEVTPDELLKDLSGVPEIYGADGRPKQLETMIHEAKSLEGK